MNIVRAFAVYLETSGVATFGENLFISRAPSSNADDPSDTSIPKNVWWLKAGGGSPTVGKLHIRTIEVYYRDLDAEKVYDKLEQLSDDISCASCLGLQDHTVIEVLVVGPFTDQDLDDENQTVGLLQVNITTFKKGC